MTALKATVIGLMHCSTAGQIWDQCGHNYYYNYDYGFPKNVAFIGSCYIFSPHQIAIIFLTTIRSFSIRMVVSFHSYETFGMEPTVVATDQWMPVLPVDWTIAARSW